MQEWALSERKHVHTIKLTASLCNVNDGKCSRLKQKFRFSLPYYNSGWVELLVMVQVRATSLSLQMVTVTELERQQQGLKVQ